MSSLGLKETSKTYSFIILKSLHMEQRCQAQASASPAFSVQQVIGQPGLHGETLPAIQTAKACTQIITDVVSARWPNHQGREL